MFGIDYSTVPRTTATAVAVPQCDVALLPLALMYGGTVSHNFS